MSVVSDRQVAPSAGGAAASTAAAAATGTLPPFVVVDGAGVEVEPVTRYLRDLALSDMSPLTSRSYGYDLPRWFPQRKRKRTRAGGTPPGVANLRTGKPAPATGYAPRTINHCLSAVYGFYAFHEHFGRGSVVNPVPSSRARRLALAHRSPIETQRQFKRARLRQRVADATPRAIPDAMWDELYAAMTCDRDRALPSRDSPPNTTRSLEHRLVTGDAVAEITRLKAEDGGPMGIGGATLAGAAMQAGLIDEYQQGFLGGAGLGEVTFGLDGGVAGQPGPSHDAG
nr:dihydrofolate reductase family protein [Saccharothrix sp. ALI-22-I]